MPFLHAHYFPNTYSGKQGLTFNLNAKIHRVKSVSKILGRFHCTAVYIERRPQQYYSTNKSTYNPYQ